ncbi:MAG: YaiI/YqxD family protein [Victivallales bacterium]|nr:YaiI/YqxD family protein [Victivallales bacterium]
MHIYVDADAFPNPLKEIIYKTVIRLNIKLTLVACQYMRVPDSPLISMRVVSTGQDAADDEIVELVEAGDLVITADIPLADRIVHKNAHAINPRGELYTEANIKQRLSMRNFMEELRNNGMETGGPPAFNAKDRQEFANQLDKFLTARLKHRKD